MHRLARPSVMSLRGNFRIGSGPALAALTDEQEAIEVVGVRSFLASTSLPAAGCPANGGAFSPGLGFSRPGHRVNPSVRFGPSAIAGSPGSGGPVARQSLRALLSSYLARASSPTAPGRPGMQHRSGPQVGEDGQYPAVLVGRLMQAELVEDAGHVAFHRGHGDRELASDTDFGAALGHLGQHLPLAGPGCRGAVSVCGPTSRATTSGSSADSPAATRRTASANMRRSSTFPSAGSRPLECRRRPSRTHSCPQGTEILPEPVGARVRTPRCLRVARGRCASSWPGTSGHHASPESVAGAGRLARAEELTGHSISVYVPVAAASHNLCPTPNARHHLA